MDTLGTLPSIYFSMGGNLCDTLFAFVAMNPFEKVVYSTGLLLFIQEFFFFFFAFYSSSLLTRKAEEFDKVASPASVFNLH